jgi:hypothetical protein
MGRCFNVVLDSSLPYVAGATTASDSYFVNWDAIMPDKPYKVSFSFMSEIALVTGTVVMGIQVNLGGGDVYNCVSGNSRTLNYLGSAHSSDIAALHYMNAGFNDNPPIYLSQRPNNNVVTVSLTNGTSQTLFTTPNPSDYVLILHFEEI